MKIKGISDPKALFSALERCKGDVILQTTDGDTLNIKSKLSQYICMMNVFTTANIGEIEIMFTEPEDVQQIMAYLISGGK